MTPEALAAESARIMWAEDRAAQALGMSLTEVAPGRARMEMAVTDKMTNGHGICHGGYIFTLADTTFAYACNSHNQRAVAAGAEIQFLAPAHLGDLLRAEGIERHRAKRSGIYDVQVSDQNGRRIALFRGRSATIKGQFVATEDDSKSKREGTTT